MTDHGDTPAVPIIDYRPRGLTQQQVAVLLFPLDRGRVHRDPGGNSYLPQQDIRAHLTRVFGFGNWSSHVLEVEQVYVGPAAKANGQPTTKVDCLWRATVRLDIRDQHGNHLATYEDAATGDAQNSTPLAAHDLALKSAVSTALKRAATSLGDQFGLSLYNKGSLDAFVERTLIGAPQPPADLAGAPAATEEQDPDARTQVDEGGTPGYDGDAAGAGHENPDQAPDDPEERAERAVTQRYQRRQEVNAARTGPEQARAKARLWDAVTEWNSAAYGGTVAPTAFRNGLLADECARRGWNLPAQLHTDRLLELAAYYEEKADDDIRARIARGE